jgi:bifunctional non-homologous end joining protein LigD
MAERKRESADRLGEYRSKRSFEATPEPDGGGEAAGEGSRFVIQEHHATRLHWDFRLERDGVLVSWALPRGVPLDPSDDHLAVHTEDHPLDYFDFEGEIPKGEYGGGQVTQWDAGRYETEKWEDGKVVVRLDGGRVAGRYALFRTGKGGEKNWMIHRMDPPPEGREPMPRGIEPMKARLSVLPASDDGWGYEVKWDGVRAIAYCGTGRVRLESRTGRDVTASYPELGAIAEGLAGAEAVLDGEVVALDDQGAPSFQRLQRRMHVSGPNLTRRLREDVPVSYVIFDLLYLDGETLLELPYAERRARLEALALEGDAWRTPSFHVGDGAALLGLTRSQGLEGIVGKRLDSKYRPGKRGREWIKVKNVRGQEVVIGGWLPGKGRRGGGIGALLCGYWEGEGDERRLRFAGKVGTGFSEDELAMLAERLEPLRRETSPFDGRQPERAAIFAEPELVAEVEFAEWTSAGTMRHPSYKGLRDDRPPESVVREEPESAPEA